MWSQLNEEVSSIKRQFHQNVSSVKEVTSKAQKILFGGGPGLFLDIHQKCKSVYPKNRTGINLIINKIINDQVDYNFNITINPSEANYTPYNAYLGREIQKYNDERCQIGSSCLSFRHRLSNELMLSILGYIQHVDAGTAECALDYYGENFTSSVGISHENVSKAEISLQHLHGINKNLAIGAEINLQTTNNLSVVSKGLSLVGRFHEKNTDSTISGTLNNRGLQFCLYKQINSKIKIGTILDVCLKTKSIVGSLACDVFDKSMRFQTSIDSKGAVVFNLSTENFYKSDRIIFKPTISALFTIQKRIDFGIGFEMFI